MSQASPFHLLNGNFTVLGKSPDGDSIRFIPEHPEQLKYLEHSHSAKISRDGSVQLRLEGIDAPELHYGGAHQPYAQTPRDQFLKAIGFFNLQYAVNGEVTHAEPLSIPGSILSASVDINGRPISYVLPRLAFTSSGEHFAVDEQLLLQTFNYKLLGLGAAYPIFYTSLPIEHQHIFREASLKAKEQKRGVWAIDKTFEFELQYEKLRDEQLIFPKLFRRSVEYLRSGFAGTLTEWLCTEPDKNDKVILPGTKLKHLSDLLQQEGRKIRLQTDFMNVVFVEK